MIEEELTKIIKAAESLNPYLKKNIYNECKVLAAKYNNLVTRNESILKEKYKISGEYKDSMEKIVHLSILHGYDSININEIKDNFIRWMVKNTDHRYKNSKITRELLTQLSTEYYMFVLDNDREPKDYTEFKSYITNDKS